MLFLCSLMISVLYIVACEFSKSVGWDKNVNFLELTCVITTVKPARCHHHKNTVFSWFGYWKHPKSISRVLLLSTPHYLFLCSFYHDVQWQRCVLFPLSGNLIPRHQELFYKNPVFAGVRLPEIKEIEPLERRYPKLSEVVIDLAKVIVLFTFLQWIYIVESWLSCLVDLLG